MKQKQEQQQETCGTCSWIGQTKELDDGQLAGFCRRATWGGLSMCSADGWKTVTTMGLCMCNTPACPAHVRRAKTSTR